MNIFVKKLKPEAIIPTRAHAGDAGLDLYAIEPVLIPVDSLRQIRTGIGMEIPDGYVGLIWDKSGLSQNFKLKVFGGVIDSTYRGEIVVGLVNFGSGRYVIDAGQKIAQLLIQKIEPAKMIEVDSLEETARGEKGFGSTGA